MKKLNPVKLLYIFILLHPIIDLLTALMTRFEISVISIGIVIRGLFILAMLVYLFFFNGSRYRRKSIMYIVILFLFCIMYFITKQELIFNVSFFKDEFIYMFKYMYFPIIFICLLNFCDQYNIDRKKIVNIFIINLIIYAILLIVPFLTDTGFNSYAENKGIGVVGWFFSANEIGAILAIIFPLIFLYINKKLDFKINIAIILILFSVMLIGTKVAYFGCLGAIIVTLIYYLFNLKKYKIGHFILLSLLLLTMLLASSNLPVMKNIQKRISNYNSTTVVEKDNNNNEPTSDKKPNEEIVDRLDDAKVILSSRDKLAMRICNIYKQQNTTEKLLGIGFSNRSSISNQRIEKLVEMDFIDIVFRYGIIGLIIYIVPLFLTAIYIIRYLFKNRFKMSIEQCLFIYSLVIGLGAGFIAGHVFSSPPVSIYIAIMMVFSLDIFKIKNTHQLDRDKIYFLSLHLGQGGIERATINSANALCEKKKVTIICLYKLDNRSLYDIDPRIIIKYLYNGSPNRHEWKKALKDKNIITFIKNSWLAVNILFKKRYLMIREIKKIDEGIVISTTINFSLLLNNYGRNNVLKVAQEHKYHNHDRRYLRKMKYGYNNIDYIMALTNTLANDYKKLFINNKKIKIVVMPNMMSNDSYQSSNLNKKIVTAVCRLDPDKRVNEIIDIAHKLKDVGWTFKIIGDGIEYDNLKKQIEQLGLNKVVILKGMLTNNEVIKELIDSSIFVMTSISEGCPIVLIEACSIGLPVVCYEIENSLNSIVKNGQNGYLIKDRDEKIFIEKLRLLMNNDSKRKIFGKKSIVISKNYSNGTITKKWFDFIDNTSL